ncbi:hypothetical protein B7P43_G15057 [Cryptotermes secundus]|uniref:C-type lectin domain-containing protein n=2 Tax=Cryptotermes secundus TaxID=105785 RepID=A0A2J7QVN3_9NEOP|nr:hypothetical protein B7P43_G15057 [Cryptotermes secundus]
MAKLWSYSLCLLATLCMVQAKPYHEAKHRALLRTGYIYFPGGGYYRLAYKRPIIWAEARRNCQQEGASLAVVNSQQEAENLRTLYLDYGPNNADLQFFASNTTQVPVANATVHIGIHDIFIEGEYLTVRSEPLIATGFVRWKPGFPIGDEQNNCGAFDTAKYILDGPCDAKLPYICEIPEAA